MGKHHDDNRRAKVIAGAIGLVAVAITASTFTASQAAPELRTAPAQATETLRQKASVPGTAWAVNPTTNEVLVTADSTVTGAKWDNLVSTVKGMGAGVRLQRTGGTFKLFAEGGDGIFAGNSRCSLGFNVVTDDGRPAILTAGHCAAAGRQFSLTPGGRAVATVARSTFPGNGDFALLTYNNRNTAAPSEVDTGNGRKVRIQRAAEARVGTQVQRMGSTTGLRAGRVTGLNATVNYPEGRVTGLIQTTVCAEGGDSGGPLFTVNGNAIGLTSGGSGDCRSGGVTFFQPVTRALAAVGARIP
ncbi:Alpha-lytic protease prodomain-containing protein [Lentzea albidocapillata subsp. violacea]|uniref:Alpha-lytic protease prodomain-containing protein n=1 Tax=Lentzea albidocapillata subsp. violacea TaxID=128104 RepID=A0A1G8QPZ5_9PSEU|nr:S1 family peptidase [Lentzea albidocapillata]SDJ06834.1 Alpha-lytic protease prodomain-containing protein [Lentzea albidocapillata subsp. violacea]